MSGAFDNKANLYSAPVGSIVQAPYNLTDPNWLPCLGQKLNRAQYPALSACMPGVGVFTSTVRTKAAASTSKAVANDGTNWVVTGALGTSNLYTTPDGITFTPRTTPTGSDVRSILYDGTNFVAPRCAGLSPLYSINGGSTWTASATTAANVDATSTSDCMAFAKTLGTVGRFVLCGGGGTGAMFTSDDRGVTWTTNFLGLANSYFHVAWTGKQFIATGTSQSKFITSPDGIAWTENYWPFSTGVFTVSGGCIASDGNGRVVVVDGASLNYNVYISLDHGASWGARSVALDTNSGLFAFTGAYYSNGRFIFQQMMSADLQAWVRTPEAWSSSVGDTNVSYKNGVYLAVGSGTAALTLTEDLSKMYLPNPNQGAGAPGANAWNWNNYMPWIKVK